MSAGTRHLAGMLPKRQKKGSTGKSASMYLVGFREIAELEQLTLCTHTPKICRYMYTSEKLQKTALYSSIKHWLGHLVQDVEGKKQRGWRYQGREESEPLAPESESEEEEEELGEEQEEGGSNGNETSEEEFFGTYVSGVGGVWIKGMWGSDDEDEGEGEENEAEE